jgi:hypothetical protein
MNLYTRGSILENGCSILHVEKGENRDTQKEKQKRGGKPWGRKEIFEYRYILRKWQRDAIVGHH